MAQAIPFQLDTRPQDRRGRPLRDLRLSLMETCNFRCPYCMPAETHPPLTGSLRERLDFAQMETLVRAFVAVGVRKLRLTGGEPLLRRGLPDLVARLAHVPGLDEIALTTNGSLLARQAGALHDAGLSRLTISLDSLDPDRFYRLSGGRGRLQDVMEGIAAAEAVGFSSIKFNCVVQRGINDDEIEALVDRFRGTGHILRFIEYMDVGTCNGWQDARVVPSHELRHRIHQQWPLRALTPLVRGEVAERHAFVDGAGEVGFVSSISTPFCGDCHRARVSAEGRFYTCLFASDGLDLRPALALGEAAVAETIAARWRQRQDRYSELRATHGPQGRHVEMYAIGG